MKQTAHQRQHGQGRLVQRGSDHGTTDAEQDNADVFQRVVSQQALDIVFHQRIEAADKGSEHRQQQHHNAPPQRRHTQQIQADFYDAQHAQFHQAAGEQSADMRRCRAMRLRHPTVQGDHPGKHGKPEKRQYKNAGSQQRRQGAGARNAKMGAARCVIEQGESDHQQQRACATKKKLI